MRKAIDALEADEVVIPRGGTLVVSDPFLARWLRDLL